MEKFFATAAAADAVVVVVIVAAAAVVVQLSDPARNGQQWEHLTNSQG